MQALEQHNSPQVRLWDENMAHGEHAKPPQLFRGVKDHWWETTGHFGIQTNFDSSLDFILTLHQQIKQFLGIYNSFSEIGHQANESCIPFIDNLERKAKISPQLLLQVSAESSDTHLPPTLP